MNSKVSQWKSFTFPDSNNKRNIVLITPNERCPRLTGEAKFALY